MEESEKENKMRERGMSEHAEEMNRELEETEKERERDRKKRKRVGADFSNSVPRWVGGRRASSTVKTVLLKLSLVNPLVQVKVIEAG